MKTVVCRSATGRELNETLMLPGVNLLILLYTSF